MSEIITVSEIEAEHARDLLARSKAAIVLGAGFISRGGLVRLVRAQSVRDGELVILAPRQIVGDVVIAGMTVDRRYLVISSNCRVYWIDSATKSVAHELVLTSPIFFMEGVGDSVDVVVASDEIVCRARGTTIRWSVSTSTRIADFEIHGNEGRLTTDDGRLVKINVEDGSEASCPSQ